MTEEEFAVILVEIRQLRKGITEAVKQIVRQETEINAMRTLLVERKLASPEQIDQASQESECVLERLLHPERAEPADAQPRRPLNGQLSFGSHRHHERRLSFNPRPAPPG